LTASTQRWDRVAETWKKNCPQTLWRVHSDAVNTALIGRWLSGCRVDRLLKTDLFDEAFSGGLYPLLASRVQHVLGMDVSAVVLHAARSRHVDLQVVGADARCLPFADNVFDVIVSNSTLDHFESSEDIIVSLHELHRVLRSGGHLLLTLDNLGNPVIALRNILPFRVLNRPGLVPYYVGATFGRCRLCRTLEQVGFEVTEVRAVMHCLRVFAVGTASILEKCAGPETQGRFLRVLMAFECLSRASTRFLTGHFVAVKALKR